MIDHLGSDAINMSFSTGASIIKKLLSVHGCKKQIDDLSHEFTEKARLSGIASAEASRFEDAMVLTEIIERSVLGGEPSEVLACDLFPGEGNRTAQALMRNYIAAIEAIVNAALPPDLRIAISQITQAIRENNVADKASNALIAEKLDMLLAAVNQSQEAIPEWCDHENIERLLGDTITELGPRYSREVNVETASMKAFDALMQDEAIYQRGKSVLEKLSISIESFAEEVEKAAEDDAWDEVLQILGRFKSLTKDVGFCKGSDFACGVDDLLRLPIQIEECSVYEEVASARANMPNLSREWRYLESGLRDLSRFRDEERLHLLSCQVLVVCGRFGVGKSHLLADACLRLVDDGYIALLELGSHFQSGVSPFEQLASLLVPGIRPEALLQGISNATGDNLALIAIDALNEGSGQFLWKEWMHKIVAQMRSYPNLRLALSVRSPLEPTIFPEGFFDLDGVGKIYHDGFASDPATAIERYCEHYKLAPPAFPLFGDEVGNPFYLKLACEALVNRGAKQFSMSASLSDLMDDYLRRVDKNLSRYEDLGLNYGAELAVRVSRALVADEEYEEGMIPWGRAKEVIDRVAKEYEVDHRRKLPEILVSEGLLLKQERYGGQESAVFAFERLGFYAEALALLDALCKDGARSADGIGENAEFRTEIDRYKKTGAHSGLLETLAILMPEQLGIELIEVLPADVLDGKGGYAGEVQQWVISSLQWRSIPEVPDSLADYVEKYILPHEDSLRLLFMRLIGNSLNSHTAMNAAYLHGLLARFDAKVRDAFWTTTITIDYVDSSYGPMDVVMWIWSKAGELDEETAWLATITLCWLTASTNLALRGRATKALAALLSLNWAIAEKLARSLLEFDDDYVFESACAALLGGFWNSEQKADWGTVVETVYQAVFVPVAYPNVTVRDYAKSLIDAYAGFGFRSRDDFLLAEPPYESEWLDQGMSCEEIDAFEEKVIARYGKGSDQARSMWRLKSSMTTEYGRGTGAYGDFGRYVFGFAVHDWANQWNDQDLANLVLMRILEERYDFDLHSAFDALVDPYGSRTGRKIERLGKKYQWIEMHRLLARLGDNYPPFTIKRHYKPGYAEARKEAKAYDRILFSALIEQKTVDESSPGIAELKALSEAWSEEDWIEHDERAPFQDWEIAQSLVRRRDIDPTFIWQEPARKGEKSLFIDNLLELAEGCESRDEWLASTRLGESDLSFRIVEIEDRSFVVLASFAEQCDECGKIEVLSGGAFFQKGCEKTFAAKHMELNGNGVPNREFMYCYLFDHYGAASSASAMRSFDEDAFGYEKEVKVAAQSYSWSHERDHTLMIDEAPNIYLPSFELVEAFDLKMFGPGDWLNPEGELIAFEASMHGYKERALLFDADLLDAYCANHGLSIGWGEFIDKKVGSHRHCWWQSVVELSSGQWVATIDSEEAYEDDE